MWGEDNYLVKTRDRYIPVLRTTRMGTYSTTSPKDSSDFVLRVNRPFLYIID